MVSLTLHHSSFLLLLPNPKTKEYDTNVNGLNLLRGSYMKVITIFKDSQGLEDLVTLPRTGNLYVRSEKRESNPSNLTSVTAVVAVRTCLLIDYVTILLPSTFAGGKKSTSNVELI